MKKFDETAGITSGEAVAAVGNRYDLILIAAQRVRELRRGGAPKGNVRARNSVLTALQEIEQGLVGREYLLKNSRAQK